MLRNTFQAAQLPDTSLDTKGERLLFSNEQAI